MAKKEKAAKKVTAEIVGIPYLEEKFGIEGRVIRQILRKNDIHAPDLADVEGFGPRKKYSWAVGSVELADIEKLLTGEVKAKKARAEAAADKPVKKSKKPAPEVDIDEDEDDEEADIDETDEDEADDEDEDEDED